MDHLLIPSEPLHTPSVIPFLCTQEHDGGPWATYYQRLGIPEVELANPTFWTRNYGILQNWLWFGPLRAFLGAKASHKAFTRDLGRGRLVLDTSKIPDETRNWQSGWMTLPQETKLAVEAEVTTILELWYNAYQTVRCNDDTGRLILFGISVLHEAFYNMWMNSNPSASLQSLDFRSRNTAHALECENTFPWTRMRNDGWCPQQLANLNLLPPSTRYYASLTDCPDRGLNHSKCSTQSCVVYGRPTTRHFKDGCKCSMVFADRPLMSSMLLAGSFPLIRMVKDKKKGVSLKIIKHVPGIKYVALSHVWSDGLGNPDGNSLPQCQLQRLSILADAACQVKTIRGDIDDLGDDLANMMHRMATLGDSTIYLWVDTICCPVEKDYPAAHAKSLAMMPACYSQAQKVIVLDRYIESFPPTHKRFMRSTKVANATPVERIMRIRFSRWTQRLWTLQEGALAKHLLIHFSDGFLDFDQLMGKIVEATLLQRGEVAEDLRSFHGRIRCIEIPEDYAQTTGMMEHIDPNAFLAMTQQLERGQVDMNAFINQMSRVVSNARARGQAALDELTEEEKFLKKFARVCESVSTRSLSNSTDEPICLGTLLGLDVEPIALTPPDKRMDKFWSMLPHYSRSLIHYHGKTLEDTEGRDWAPATLINRAGRGDLWAGLKAYSDGPAAVSELGLHVAFPGIISSAEITQPLPSIFFITDKRSGRFWTVGRKSGEVYAPFPRTVPRPVKIGFILLSDIDLTRPKPSDAGRGSAIAAIMVLVMRERVALDQSSPAFDYVLGGPLVELSPGSPNANIDVVLRAMQLAMPNGVLDMDQIMVEGNCVPANHQWCVRSSIEND